MEPVITLRISKDGKLHVNWDDSEGTVKRVFVNNTPLGTHSISFEMEGHDKALNISYIPG